MESNLCSLAVPSAKCVSSLDLPCNNSVYPRTTKLTPLTSNAHRGELVMQKSEKEQMNFVDELTPVLNVAYRVAFHLTNNRSDAEDLVQEASLQGFRRFDAFQSGTNFKAWYLKILKNCFLMSLRKRKNERALFSLYESSDKNQDSHTIYPNLRQDISDPFVFMMHQVESNVIAIAMQALPKEYRIVCVLSLVLEYTYQEIAELLEIPLGTVRSRLHRGRKHLRIRLSSSHCKGKHDTTF